MEILRELYQQFVSFLPNFFFAFAILLLGWVASKVLAQIVKKILVTLKIDGLADRLNEIDIVQRSNFSVVPSNLIAKVVYYVLMLITLIVATEQLQINAVTSLLTDFISYLPNLLTALVFFVVGLLLADMIRGIVETTCKSLGIPSAGMISSVVFYFIFLSVAVSALDQAKISTDFINSSLTILIAGVAGAFALGYGIASKGMMSNFLASFYTKNRFNVGDQVTIAGFKGEIVEMDSNSFTLKTATSHVIFPLSTLAEKEVQIHSNSTVE